MDRTISCSICMGVSHCDRQEVVCGFSVGSVEGVLKPHEMDVPKAVTGRFVMHNRTVRYIRSHRHTCRAYRAADSRSRCSSQGN